MRTLFVYVSSYSTCGAHTKISVIKIPIAHPGRARVIGQPDVSPAAGCHDITVFMQLKIAAAACRTEGQMWDISRRRSPKITAHIQNPAIDFWHSAAFTWDGTYVVFGDEFGGGTRPGCPAPNSPVGGIWIYEVADPGEPLGVWTLPRSQQAEACTAHNFNWIPVDDRYLLVASSYAGGTSVIDFTNPALPEEIGFYDAADPPAETWSSYFYNGYIYANDIHRGIDVFAFDDPASGAAQRLRFMNPQTQMKRLFTP